MTQFTTREAFQNTEWNRMQSAEARVFAAQDAARGFAKPATLTLQQIADNFEFSRDEFNTRYDAYDNCTQVGMRIVSKTDVNDRYLVVAKVTEGGLHWQSYCPRAGWANAQIMIEAVKARTQRNQEAKRGQN